MGGLFSQQKETTPTQQWSQYSQLPQQIQGLTDIAGRALGIGTGQPPQTSRPDLSAYGNLSLMGVPISQMAGLFPQQTTGQQPSGGGPGTIGMNPYLQPVLGAIGQQEQQDVSGLRNLWGQQGQGMSEGLQKSEAQLRSGYGGEVGKLMFGQYNQDLNRWLDTLYRAYGPFGAQTQTAPSLFSELADTAAGLATAGILKV